MVACAIVFSAAGCKMLCASPEEDNQTGWEWKAPCPITNRISRVRERSIFIFRTGIISKRLLETLPLFYDAPRYGFTAG